MFSEYLVPGVCRNSTGDSGTDKLFTGQRLDDTGLYYYNARYYDPQIGRFISADTVVPNPANPQAFNRYSYVLNNPLKYMDPSGHWTLGWGIKGNVNLFCIKVEINISFIVDNSGSRDKFFSASNGLNVDISSNKRITASVALHIDYTDARSINKLGRETRMGIEIYDGFGGGLESVQGVGHEGDIYNGWSVFGGLGFGGGVYTQITESQRIGSLWDWLGSSEEPTRVSPTPTPPVMPLTSVQKPSSTPSMFHWHQGSSFLISQAATHAAAIAEASGYSREVQLFLANNAAINQAFKGTGIMIHLPY